MCVSPKVIILLAKFIVLEICSCATESVDANKISTRTAVCIKHTSENGQCLTI